jgi:hypothetical protein
LDIKRICTMVLKGFHYGKKNALQLALQFNFWVVEDNCNSLYLYVVSANGQVAWVVTHHIYVTIHCNSIVTLSKQFIFN